jgi:hypothetical protein
MVVLKGCMKQSDAQHTEYVALSTGNVTEIVVPYGEAYLHNSHRLQARIGDMISPEEHTRSFLHHIVIVVLLHCGMHSQSEVGIRLW